jgi:hypothetical protein
MIEKLKQHRLLFIVLIISIALFFLYLKIQPHLTYSFSSLFDGSKYIKVYNYFAHITDEYDVIFPINSRILVPYLSSLFPSDDTIRNFNSFNLIFIILSILAIYILWRNLKISSGHIMTGFFWLLIHWIGIIRHNIFDPITVDVPLYFFQAILLIIILQRRYLWLIILGPLATIQKESFPALLIVALLVALFEDYKEKTNYKASIIIGLSLVLSVAAKSIVAYYFPPADPGKNSIIVILFHMKETLVNPFRFIRWIVSVFTAYGPLLILALWVGVKSKTLTHGNRYIIFLSLTYLFLSHFAGGDMTRIAFLGFPFIMTWILIKLENTGGFMFKAAFIAGIPLLKILGTLSDPAVQGWDKFYNWFPGYANPIIIYLWLVYIMLCIVMFRVIDRKLAKLP